VFVVLFIYPDDTHTIHVHSY